jgi:hypothetical protein
MRLVMMCRIVAKTSANMDIGLDERSVLHTELSVLLLATASVIAVFTTPGWMATADTPGTWFSATVNTELAHLLIAYAFH